jgi:hypothetical protein
MTTDTRTATYADIREAMLAILRETFEEVGRPSAFLDPGNALFETLAQVSAGQASRPVGTCGNSVAGQVAHLNFYFDVGFKYMRGENPGPQDWSLAWQTVEVSEEEWEALKRGLRERHRQLVGIIEQGPPEVTADILGGMFGVVAHTAFHLGQIRHALCMLASE